MIYYELLDKISSILEDKIEEILFLIENDMRNQRYKFTGEESLYSYMIVLDDVYEVLTPFIQDGNIVENIVGISKRVFDLKLKNASRSNVDIQKIKDKYFSKKNVKNEKIIRYGIAVLLLIIYTVILIFLNSDNINHIPSILFTIVIISFFSLKPKHK